MHQQALFPLIENHFSADYISYYSHTNLPALTLLKTEGLIQAGGTISLVRMRSSGLPTSGFIPING
jgi:hypothetical protein